MRLRCWLALAAALALTGCASVPPRVIANITEFHQMPPPSADTTLSVLPWREDLKGSLEFQAYARQIADGLRAKGYSVAAVGEVTRFAVFVDYGIDTGRTEVSTYSIPKFGVTGYSGAQTTGTVSTFGNTSYLNATTTATPTYGVTGYTQGVSSTRVFRRFVNLDVVDLAASTPSSPKKLYEGRLQSEGGCGALPAVMPSLLTGLMQRFPGESGKARQETVQMPVDCPR